MAPKFGNFLVSRKRRGISPSCAEQRSLDGLAQSSIVSVDFAPGGWPALILGADVFPVAGVGELLKEATPYGCGATAVGYDLADPERGGVASFESQGAASSIEEKPTRPRCDRAASGPCFYDADVVDIAAAAKASAPAESEIADVDNVYPPRGDLRVQRLGRRFAPIDTWMPEPLVEAANFVHVVEGRQGLQFRCAEEVAFARRYIFADQLGRLASALSKSAYGRRLARVAADRECKTGGAKESSSLGVKA